MDTHPEAMLSVRRSSSGGGIAELLADELDIAAASRPPDGREFQIAREREIALKTYVIALDALCIIVHPDRYRSVRRLTRAQANALFFTGTVRNWAQLVPESDDPIVVYGREQHNSGTASMFAEHVTGRRNVPYAADVVVLDRTDRVAAAIAQDPNGVGMVSLSMVNDSVRALEYGTDAKYLTAPSLDNVRGFHYPLRRDLFLITRGTPEDAISDFVRFMLDTTGQSIVSEHNLISIY